jgi:hypothetical protein
MMRKRLSRALTWRFGALATRLDALANRADALGERLERVELLTRSVADRTAELAGVLEEVRAHAAEVPQLAADVSASRDALDHTVHPMLRAILDEESQNRRRLFALRDSPTYLDAYSDPDPLVSVTVPTIGRVDALVNRSLPSLLSQSHTNLEVLVVGDAAPPEVEEAVTALGDPRVRYANLSQRLLAHSAPRRHWLAGGTMARNEAVRRARGLWLLHFDDDDHLRPGSIERLLELARERRAEVVYGGTEQHYPEGNSATLLGFPPEWGKFTWPAALVHSGLRFLERELIAAHLDLPGDIYMLERMLRTGVRFAMLDAVLLDYYPSTLWKPSDEPDGPDGPDESP